MSHTNISVHLPAEHALTVNSSAFDALEIRRIESAETEVYRILKDRTIRIGPFSDPRQYRIISERNSFDYSMEEESVAYNHEGSGIFSGGTVSINATDNTKFDVAAGLAVLVNNYTDPEVPEVIHIQWPDLVGITTEFLSTDFGTFVGINKMGAIVQFPSSDSVIDKRDNVILGVLGHSNRTSITSAASIPTPGYDQTHVVVDMSDALGVINKTGNVYGPNGANLNVNKLAGETFAIGYNYPNSTKSPNITEDAAITAVSFFTGYRDGSGGFTLGSSTTTIPVANYDNGTGTLAAVPASDPCQIFRIYWFPGIGNNVLIYGQNIYKSLAEAEGALFGEVYEEPDDVKAGGILRAFLLVRRDATDLSDTGTAKFIQANSFGGAPASGVSTATTTLQQAYANSAEPEIVTNTTQNAITFKEGSGTATSSVLEITNNSDAVVLSIDGQGQITGAIDGGVTGSRPGTPVDYQMYFDTTLGIPIWYDGTNWVNSSGATV